MNVEFLNIFKFYSVEIDFCISFILLDCNFVLQIICATWNPAIFSQILHKLIDS